jgi:hypothetical protein
LLNASALSDYAQLAPDADYAQLPFEETFRGQPNNGDRLYETPASVHGLYVSLRPTSGQPQQITIDAMQLRNERFYSYIPQLMERVDLVIPKSPKILFDLLINL